MVEPKGLKWISVYIALVALGYMQSSLEYFAKESRGAMTLGFIAIFLGFVLLIVVYGLWKKKLWGYKLSKIFLVILFFFEIILLSLDLTQMKFFLHLQIAIVVSGIFIYLQKERVGLWFGCQVTAFKLHDKTFEASLAPENREQVKTELAEAWKKENRNTYVMFMIAALIFLMVVSGKLEPVLELNEMKVVEGVLLDITEPGYKRGRATLTVRDDEGVVTYVKHSFINPYYDSVKAAEGKQIKIWVTDDCFLFGYMCREGAKQVEFNGKLTLDYNNFVRKNLEKANKRGSGSDLFFFGLFLILVWMGRLARGQAKLAVIEIREKYKKDSAV